MSRVHAWLALWLFVGACGPGAAHEEASSSEEEEEESAPPGEVRLTEEQVAAAGIVVGRAERALLSGSTVVPAEIQLDPTRTAHVSSLVDGRLRDARVGLGDVVHAGDVLGVLASADAGALAAAIADTQLRLTVAEGAATRLEALGASGVTSQRALLEAQGERDRARAELAGLSQRRGVVGGRGHMVSLIAPLDGVVVDLHAVPGEAVAAGEMVFTVADTQHVWAIGRAPELAIAELHEGLPATLRLHAYPSERFDGTVALLAPMLDEATRTLAVRVELDDTTGRLRAGLFGSLAIGSAEGAVITVPETAIATVHGADVVFVPEEAGTFRVRHVAVGHRSGGLAEIADGLAEGDAIVSVGAFVLKSHLLRAELQEGD